LPQQNLPEIERIKEKLKEFIFRKVSQIRTFNKVHFSPSPGITVHIPEKSVMREFPKHLFLRKYKKNHDILIISKFLMLLESADFFSMLCI